MLEMKDKCERCSLALEADGKAMICSYECTFCEACASEMSHRCPKCGGVLVQRPPRAGTRRSAAGAA